jgi:hypothetical protein
MLLMYLYKEGLVSKNLSPINMLSKYLICTYSFLTQFRCLFKVLIVIILYILCHVIYVINVFI